LIGGYRRGIIYLSTKQRNDMKIKITTEYRKRILSSLEETIFSSTDQAETEEYRTYCTGHITTLRNYLKQGFIEA